MHAVPGRSDDLVGTGVGGVSVLVRLVLFSDVESTFQRQQKSSPFCFAPYVAAPHADTGHSVEFERAVADGSVVGRVLDEQRGQHEVMFSIFSVFLFLKGVDF